MLRKLLTVVVLGVSASAGLSVVGCASGNGNADKPYSLTGDQKADRSDDWRYTDSKGHYHPEMRAKNTPLH